MARPDLRWIALATGDSDFSPLFRRLREMGRQVIGAGPRSALSESVKSSCSRFIYLDHEKSTEKTDEATFASAFDDAADLLEKALGTFDEPANCSTLKARMLNIDSAFDEKKLGFKGFNDFVEQVDTVELHQNGKSWLVSFVNQKTIGAAPQVINPGVSNDLTNQDLVDKYRSILRKKGWRSLPLPIIEECYYRLKDLDVMTRSEMAELAIAGGEASKLTAVDVKKVMSMLMKAGVITKVENQHGPDGDESYWRVTSLPIDQVSFAIDRAMVIRLLSWLEEFSVPFCKESIAPLLLLRRPQGKLDALITEARQLCRASDRSQ